jgi:hypothetical protein
VAQHSDRTRLQPAARCLCLCSTRMCKLVDIMHIREVPYSYGCCNLCDENVNTGNSVHRSARCKFIRELHYGCIA